MSGLSLSLGPVLYNWAPEKKRDFYFRIADEAPIDIVHLGEAVCSKRDPFFAPLIPEVAERLAAAGKTVVHSSLALIMNERERNQLKALAEQAGQDFLIEANDIAAVGLLAGKPHTVGPFVNVYNETTLAWLAANGARRVALPAELTRTSLAAIARANAASDHPVALEVQVFGRLPLAISARCYHARSRHLAKDSCQYVCGDDPDGMDVDTLDGEAFLAVNGTQTLSYTYANLAAEIPEMAEMGVSVFRLWPQDMDMVATAQTFRALLDGETDADAATERLADLAGHGAFSNGFYHGREGVAAIGALDAVLGREASA